MNTNNLQQIFNHYIDKFELINSPKHEEYYKWQIAKQFRPLMDSALSCSAEEFVARLKEIKKLTSNLIDSYTQPLQGLVEFAKEDPNTVQSMFKELYNGDPDDINDTQLRVSGFLEKCHALRSLYAPDSYLYKNDMHSVTGYLFLYDPDHNYLYKASHAKIFADCIDFYEEWGEGDNVRLSVYYKMCDQLVDAIKSDDALLATDASRFNNGWGVDPITLHPDNEKHILAFDLIYCCSTYGLFDGISFERPKTKERQLLQERKIKALKLADRYELAKVKYGRLIDAKAFIDSAIVVGNRVQHKTYGEGVIKDLKDTMVTIEFPELGVKKFGVLITANSGLIDYRNEELSSRASELKDLLENEVFIKSELKESEKALAPYLEFLE